MPPLDSPFVPQLLTVYNRRFHPLTIRTHVEHLRKHGSVWWGRFRADSARLSVYEARTEWPHVAALADARRAAGEPTALFVTNFEALHVCKVTEIVLGDDPRGEPRSEALDHYREHSVPIWFRVVDVRALSYDMTTTDDWFNSQLGVVLGGSKRRRAATGKFDPYATAEYTYPILLEAPRWELLFPETRTSKPRWADQVDAMAPRPVHEARKELEKKLARVWKRISAESRELLANAWVQTKKLEAGQDDDPGMGFTRLAIAVENELARGLVPALEALVPRLKAARAPGAVAIAESLAAARPREGQSRDGAWTLGPAVGLLRRLVSHNAREIDALGLKQLATLCREAEWLARVVEMRNFGSHGGNEAKAAQKAALGAFFAHGGREMEGVLGATEGVTKWKAK
jgi:hypothetical protein